jgi:hypothetical protein
MDTDKYDNVNLDCKQLQYAPTCAEHKAALQAGWKLALPKPAAYQHAAAAAAAAAAAVGGGGGGSGGAL